MRKYSAAKKKTFDNIDNNCHDLNEKEFYVNNPKSSHFTDAFFLFAKNHFISAQNFCLSSSDQNRLRVKRTRIVCSLKMFECVTVCVYV